MVIVKDLEDLLRMVLLFTKDNSIKTNGTIKVNFISPTTLIMKAIIRMEWERVLDFTVEIKKFTKEIGCRAKNMVWAS